MRKSEFIESINLGWELRISPRNCDYEIKKLQIGERLAILWILQDEDRARQVVEYVEAKAKKKQVKGSTAGYIRTLYESDAVVGKTLFEEKKSRKTRKKSKKSRERR